MYNLIYTVPFVNIDGEALTIQILEKDGTAASTVLTGGTPAFTIDVDDENFLYTPTRFSGATLKVVGSDYLQNLFSTQYQKFKVNLIKDSTVIWTGFITPEVYSQDYDNSLFELEIECISALSTLKYVDFSSTNVTISFMDLIKKCITESNGDYKAVYIPNSYTSSLDGISVSTSNFFDEENKAMNLVECLEEICRFLNWTVTEWNGNVYFIDIDYIKAGGTAYTNILTNTSATLSSSIVINNITSKGCDNKLSILGGYNKAVIIDSDYEIDSDKIYPDDDFFWQTPMKTKSYTDDTKIYVKNYATSDAFDNHYYAQSNSTTFNSTTTSFDTSGYQTAGSFFVKRTSYDTTNKPNSLTYESVFELKQFDDTYTGTGKTFIYDLGGNYPVITAKNKSASITIDSGYKMAIDFKMQLTNSNNGFVYDSLPKISISDLNNRAVYVTAKLRIGTKYYNGTTWTTDSSNTFNIYTDVSKDTYYNTFFNVLDTNDFSLGVSDLTGTIINIDQTLTGDVELILYNPIVPAVDYDTLSSIVAIKYIYIKDIKLQSQRINTSINDDKKQDTKYENVVNESYINALDDIKFKITSKNDSELSYSKAIQSNAILDTLTNNIYSTTEKPEKLLIKRIINQYQQPKIKLVQVIKPEIQPYSIVTDNYLSGKQFIFTGGSINLEDNSIECNLIEIK